MTVELLTEHHLEFLSLKGGCIGLCESTLAKMSHCIGNHLSLLICNREPIEIQIDLRIGGAMEDCLICLLTRPACVNVNL